MITEPVSAHGFSPEPQHGAFLTGLLDLVAADAVPTDRLANLVASRLAETVGDACLVSLRADGGNALRPLAVADTDETAERVLVSLVGHRVEPGRRPDLSPYAQRFGRADELVVPMRARGRVAGELVALRRGDSPPFTAAEKRLIQAVADVLALGLDELRLPIPTPSSDVPAPDNLSRREREVLALLALGHTNREIAEHVHLSIRTVEWHRARIQAKLRVSGRAALAQVARTHGLLRGTERLSEE